MAASTQVQALAASQVRKSEYRGNVQAIPVTLESQAAGSYAISEVLPPNSYVGFCYLIPSAGDVDIGYAGDTDAVATGASSVTQSGTVVDVSGKTLLATTDATASVDGVVMIVTDE